MVLTTTKFGVEVQVERGAGVMGRFVQYRSIIKRRLAFFLAPVGHHVQCVVAVFEFCTLNKFGMYCSFVPFFLG